MLLRSPIPHVPMGCAFGLVLASWKAKKWEMLLRNPCPIPYSLNGRCGFPKIGDPKEETLKIRKPYFRKVTDAFLKEPPLSPYAAEGTRDLQAQLAAAKAGGGLFPLGKSYLEVPILVVLSRVISRVTILVTHIRGLITPLISTHEPPSRVFRQRNRKNLQ